MEKNENKPWIDTGEVINWCVEYWQCPDCGEVVWAADEEDIKRYKLCPICGNRRVMPDEN